MSRKSLQIYQLACLEARRSKLWLDFRRACACLPHTKCTNSSARLCKFRDSLEDEIPSSTTIVARLRELEENLHGDANELQALLEERLKSLHYGK
jgi:hypothetical protein